MDTWDRGLLTNTGRSVKFPQFDRGELQKPLLVKLNLSPLAQGPQKLFLMGQLTGSASIRSAPSQAEGPQSTEDNQPRSGHIESDPKQPGKLPLCDVKSFLVPWAKDPTHRPSDLSAAKEAIGKRAEAMQDHESPNEAFAGAVATAQWQPQQTLRLCPVIKPQVMSLLPRCRFTKRLHHTGG